MYYYRYTCYNESTVNIYDVESKKLNAADCDRAPPPGASGASMTASSKLESLADIRCANKFTAMLNA